jgi:RNase P subunit RPR2
MRENDGVRKELGKMSERKKWDDLYEEASRKVLRWRQEHKKATLTEIEDSVDNELAKMRARMVQDLALTSETADLPTMAEEKRPKCPQCGRPLVANGRQKRALVTDHEQVVELKRSKGYCRHCQLSFFPPR